MLGVKFRYAGILRDKNKLSAYVKNKIHAGNADDLKFYGAENFDKTR